MAMKMDQVHDDIVRRVIELLASQPNNVLGLADLHANFSSVMKKQQLELLLRKYADQFELFEDVLSFVRLVIKIKVCEMHCSKQTCPGKIPFGTDLHVCKFYILYGNCKSSTCQFGHDLTTAHNMEVLRQHLLDQLPMSCVEDLLKHSIAATKICESYNKNGGCSNDESGKPCPFLHLCINYITRECMTQNCQRSHFIHESTVRNVLEKHGISMERTPKENLAIFRIIMRSNDGNYSRRDGPIPEPMFGRNAATEICESYNKNGGCRKDKAGKPCPYLHLCKNYIIWECKRKKCQRSHFIHESTVRNVLKKHDISMGKIPKENLAVFRTILRENDGNYSGRDGPIPEPMFGRGRPPQGKLIRSMSGMTLQDSGVEPTSRRPPLFPAQGGEAVIPGKRATRSAYPTTPARTMRSQSPVVPFNIRRASPSPVGRMEQAKSDMVSETAANNILNKKICIYYLKSRCAYFKRCFNYHCELLYQWFYRFDDSDNWETVEPQENMRMELHYCDPANVEYNLFIEDMSVQLKFKTMKAEGGGKHLTFHRLSTETSAILDSHPLATSWQWFWMGGNGDWNKYGDDADGYRSTISSQDLEQAYISNPDGQLNFTTQGHEYVLDFANMVQRNLFYTTEREVSRRPKFVSKDELERRKKQPIIQKPAGSATSGFVPVAPPHWNLRPTDELLNHCKLIPLDERNSSMKIEYKKIESMFFETMSRMTDTIVSISRVENGDLWYNYLSKKDKLKKRNKGVDVEERQLFHGTSNDTVEAIYRQGFDFRLSGTASGTAYGKGSYFATTAKYSNCYTDRQKETMGMFIAKVLVGDYTIGDKSYTRPPQKDPLDLSSPLYDSCVDNVKDPKIFVIFELGQVYPEYLIKYSKKV
ncbi:protein mono-ADP-ribosyltransferase PARP12-like isoform X2 [Mya arenaria]|uniref:protein mono-ADP-ribosyltransferase PARP12-like isoform X2 n=1 Tax=Mya arenaria TaxID=6604 RepID=UPI0022DEDA31|nr:protein mono-ADP-ribosyltransferase PARP12-like isoform X2 [Mya arenaria]